MNDTNTIYAAYGSNMNLTQMERRCPYATPLGPATLTGYRLVFRGHPGGAVATVEPEEGSCVSVLLWELTPRCEEALDHYEGWPRFYRKETVTVMHREKPTEAMIYIMNEGYPLGAPGEHYFDAIREGYATAGLDEAVLHKAANDSGRNAAYKESGA